MDIVLVNVKEYDKEKAMKQEETTVAGFINAMGVDGFVDKNFIKAECFDNIEHLLTDEQKEIVEDIKKSWED